VLNFDQSIFKFVRDVDVGRNKRSAVQAIALHGVDLHGVALHGVALHGVDLHGVDLHGVVLPELRFACSGLR
jgi:uncharacterized protein YjbI with pentapeptide repeats